MDAKKVRDALHTAASHATGFLHWQRWLEHRGLEQAKVREGLDEMEKAAWDMLNTVRKARLHTYGTPKDMPFPPIHHTPYLPTPKPRSIESRVCDLELSREALMDRLDRLERITPDSESKVRAMLKRRKARAEELLAAWDSK